MTLNIKSSGLKWTTTKKMSLMHGMKPEDAKKRDEAFAHDSEVQHHLKKMPTNPKDAGEYASKLHPKVRESLAQKHEAPHFAGSKWAADMAKAIRG